MPEINNLNDPNFPTTFIYSPETNDVMFQNDPDNDYKKHLFSRIMIIAFYISFDAYFIYVGNLLFIFENIFSYMITH